MKVLPVKSILCLWLSVFGIHAQAGLVFDDDFLDPSLSGWRVTYQNTDSENGSYDVSESLLRLTYLKPTGSNIWTSLELQRVVPNIQDFHFKVNSFWEQTEIKSAPFVKIILYSGGNIVLALNYEDRSKAGFGVWRSYAERGGWNLINSVPSAEGVAQWEVDRVGENVAVRLNGEVFSAFSDGRPITQIRAYLQGYAMINSQMEWDWQDPLTIGLDRMALFSEAQNPIPTPSNLWLPSIFSDGMVLQQGKDIRVWGKALVDQPVTVSLDQWEWETQSDSNGNWALTLPAQIGGFESHVLSVACSGETRTFNDVLIGEVWFCSGQSNMEWWLGYTKEAEEALAAPEDPGLRFFAVYKEVSDVPVEDPRGRWLSAQRDTVGDFSAVAYQFGLYLKQKLNVPVGLVVAAWGGTRAECWTSRELLENQFPSLLDRWQQQLDDYDPNTMPYDQNPMLAYYRPAGLYNGMVCPVRPYSIRGFLWYQGESNRERAEQYRTLFPALIKEWRTIWNETLPFIFVQLPNYGERSSVPRESDWAELRDAQNQALKLSKVGMAVTIDIGDPVLLHPDNKKEVGRRLGLKARRIAYGDQTVPQSPRVESDSGIGSDGSVQLVFSHVSFGGLASVGGGNEVAGFTIAGEDGVFQVAQAEISEGNIVRVWSPSVQDPVEVRYAWDDNPTSDLIDKDSGLPVGTFSKSFNFGSGTNAFSMTFTTIGSSENAAQSPINRDHSELGGDGLGTVDYAYDIGVYEVTIDQFTKADTESDNTIGNGNENHWQAIVGVAAPATQVSFHEVARFCNWLTSGNATNGAYQIDGSGNVVGIDRSAAKAIYGRVYVLPSMDEWHKAAYFDMANEKYALYAFGTNTAPVAGSDATYGNTPAAKTWVVGSGSKEQNGTYDMMGNVFEWIELVGAAADQRRARGGNYQLAAAYLESDYSASYLDTREDYRLGFRVVVIGTELADHEPSTIVSLSAYSGNVLEMVVNCPTPESSYPKVKNDLVADSSWDPIGHSTSGSGPFITNNLGTVRGALTIYLEATGVAAFYGIGEE